MKFKTLPDIETNRLWLKKVEPKHIDVIFKLRSSAIVAKYIQRPLYKNRKEARLYIDKVTNQLTNDESITWVISLKTENREVGTICLWNFSEDKKIAEVGFDLLPEYFNMGIMTEASEAVINCGFNSLQLNTIEAFTKKENIASINLILKQGFVLQPDRKDPMVTNNAIYILKRDR
ncbi:GNAT family N-acetyltransferase [Lacinutrix sp. Hel_I_90]|uniref:GNAT family N-acetyltransferase n=1 Tax=Lacinutrix sp. Hel_I_90 TaxID=1249999 RepID=UPI0005C80FC4|nr:GNAT family N-acetyltransferase [Lacinutrix sp. Hel_I_90]